MFLWFSSKVWCLKFKMFQFLKTQSWSCDCTYVITTMNKQIKLFSWVKSHCLGSEIRPLISSWDWNVENSYLKTLGSIPWRGRVWNGFSIPPSQLLCRFVCAWPPFLCTACTQICVHVKDPLSICRKRVSLAAGGMETQKHCTQKRKTPKNPAG